MATSNTIPVVIPQPIAAQATSENINVIPNGATGTNGASFQEGFPAITRMPVIENPLPTQVSGLPPKQQDFNGLFNVVSQHNFFSQNGGTYSFNQAVSDAIGGYPKNSVLWYFPENEDPFLVYSLINNNTNNFVENPTLIDDEHWKKLSFGGGGGEIGDVMFCPLGIDESLNLRRYLNGQVIIQSQFVSFTNKVKSAIAFYPNLATTEENWQAEKTMSKLGQCGKFVVDDTAGTIRLPAVVNAQSLLDLALIGGIKSESLPNINGYLYGPQFSSSGGAFSTSETGANLSSSGSANKSRVDFSASSSSSTYQDNAPVQQEAVQYPYCIVVNTGVEESDRPINNYQVNNVYSYGMSQYYKGTMNNNSWLKSAGQWNAGTVYTGMYNWLLEQMNAGVSGFVASTGEYTDYDFVINTADQTFRLPLLNGSEDLPGDTFENITYNGHGSTYTATKNGTFCIVGYGSLTDLWLSNITAGIAIATEGNTEADSATQCFIDAKKGDIIEAGYYNGNVTKFGISPATGNGSLYYYIGDTLQNAQLVNVARIEETLVNKADTDLSNCTKPYVTETYRNGTEWYRIYSDGWIEQGGWSGSATVTLLKSFSDTTYTVQSTCLDAGTTNFYASFIQSKSVNSFVAFIPRGSLMWQACGY